MLGNYERQKANKALKQILREYQSSYNAKVKNSRNEYLQSMKPGQQIPSSIPLSSQDRARFEEDIDRCKAKVADIIKPLHDELEDYITKAPSTEATNTIMMLSLRSNVSETDISSLMSKYGENVQAYKAIRDIAIKHDIRGFNEHEAEVELANIDDLSKSIMKTMSTGSAESGHASDGFISIMEVSIDSALPCEN